MNFLFVDTYIYEIVRLHLESYRKVALENVLMTVLITYDLTLEFCLTEVQLCAIVKIMVI